MVAFHAVVLAAGQGVRMKSAIPKVLHPLAGRPLVAHVIDAAAAAGAASCSVVVPPDAAGFDAIRSPIETRFFEQRDRLGTAHAVLTARPALAEFSSPVVVLYGDTPLVSPESIQKLVAAIEAGAAMAVIGFSAKEPKGYGRLITSGDGELLAIREEKDATPEERALTLCNSGIMAFNGAVILSLLDRIDNKNKAGEYYLTDAVEIARSQARRVAFETIEEDEVRGVNTRAQLAEAEAIVQTRLRRRAMDGGATLIAPDTVTFCHDTVVGQDVLIEPNVFFGPGVVIEDGVTIKGFCHFEGARIGAGAVIGPFARFRPGARLGGKRQGRQFRRAESRRYRRRRQGQPPDLYRGRAYRREGAISAPARSPAITTATRSTRPTSAPALSSARTARWWRPSPSAMAPMSARAASSPAMSPPARSR